MKESLRIDKRKVHEVYRQLMNVLERNSATTEEGFTALVTGIKTIIENPAIAEVDRTMLKQHLTDALNARYVGGPQLITPGLAN